MNLVVRQERLRRGWTQAYVAAQIGVTKATLQRIETAKRNPSFATLRKMEDLFSLPCRRLFAVADYVCNPTENHSTNQQ